MNDPQPVASPRRKTVTLLWAGAVVGLIGFFFAALAGPKFVAFPCRSRQSEAKGNLKALWIAERAYFEAHGAFSDDFAALGFTERGGHRYLVGFAEKRAGSTAFKVNDASSPLVKQLDAPEVQALLTDCVAEGSRFRAFAVGNIDDDDALDIWTISEANDLTSVASDCAR